MNQAQQSVIEPVIQPAVRRRLRSQFAPLSDGAIRLGLERACSDERCTLEAQIAERFSQHYGARLSHFLPYLLSLRSHEELTAVVGLRPADSEQLYLEGYLDQSVESAIAQVTNQPIARSSIVEIGNLVSVQSGTSYLLFALLATLLHQAGFSWVVCTATHQVQQMLRNMGLKYSEICNAELETVRDNSTDWGSYYDTRPKIITGNLADAANLVAENPQLAMLIRGLQPQIMGASQLLEAGVS